MIKYDRIIKYMITAKCEEPLHVGSAGGDSEAVLIHPVDGLPFLQASGIAGALRGYYTEFLDEGTVGELFGARTLSENSNASDYSSRIKVTDGTFDVSTLKMEYRPHVSINRQTGSVSSKGASGQLFNMEYVGTGAEFVFTLYLFEDSSAGKLDAEVDKLLVALKSGEIAFGGKKSSGTGSISLVRVCKKEFDLTEKEGRKLWSSEDCLKPSEYTDITESISTKIMSRAYSIDIIGQTEAEMLVKGLGANSFGEGVPDSVNIKNANGDYIIPGSSVRGTIRSQMERIAAYMSKQPVIDSAYGVAAENQSDSASGCLVFHDTVIGKREDNDRAPVRHRIHIDKFTGGVIAQALFAEQNTFGEVNLHVDVLNKDNCDATAGLLILALRDLAIGTINLGGGYATGKGFMDVDKIVIAKADKCATINIANGVIEDPDRIIDHALSALKEV